MLHASKSDCRDSYLLWESYAIRYNCSILTSWLTENREQQRLVELAVDVALNCDDLAGDKGCVGKEGTLQASAAAG